MGGVTARWDKRREKEKGEDRCKEVKKAGMEVKQKEREKEG